MSRTVVVDSFNGVLWIDSPEKNALDVLFLDDYFKDRFSPTKQELEMFQMVTGVVPIVEERHGEKL